MIVDSKDFSLSGFLVIYLAVNFWVLLKWYYSFEDFFLNLTHFTVVKWFQYELHQMLLKISITRGFPRLYVLNQHPEIRVLYKTGGAKI